MKAMTTHHSATENMITDTILLDKRDSGIRNEDYGKMILACMELRGAKTATT
jgi:hypothetical protein